MNLGMTRWENTTQNALASRSFQFFYSTINGTWRVDNDTQGVDGNNVLNHAFNAFNTCYFTDSQYISGNPQLDSTQSMHLLMWDGYNSSSRTCSITIWD